MGVHGCAGGNCSAMHGMRCAWELNPIHNKVDTISDFVRIATERIGPSNGINRRVVTNL